jgi:hypothetical protein
MASVLDLLVPFVVKDHLPHSVTIGEPTSHDGLRVRSSPASTTGTVGDSDINSEMATQALFNNGLGLVEGAQVGLLS